MPRRPIAPPSRQTRSSLGGFQYEKFEPRKMMATIVADASLSGPLNWTDSSTWIGGVVPSENDRAIIPQNTTVLLDGTDHVVRELVIQGNLEAVETAGIDRGITSNWIHVNSGGVLQIGTASNRYDEAEFEITLTGENTGEVFQVETATGSVTVADNNSFLIATEGGSLQFFGDQRTTYTRLAATANAGENQILIHNAVDRNYDGVINGDDGFFNWQVGDQIVIASSTQDYQDEDVRIVTAIADQGDGTTLLTLDSALSNRHNGNIETYNNDTRSFTIDLRAEVAVLSRNVRVQGLAYHDTDNSFGDRARFSPTPGEGDGFGGHTLIYGSAGRITIDSVQFDGLGQTAREARYPIQWYKGGDRTGDLLINSSITNSNNRGVVHYITNGVRVEGVVLHDIQGHGFFTANGVETDNEFISNIAFGIHAVGRSITDPLQRGPDINDPFIVDTHDVVGQNPERFLSSAAFWITNPDNTFVGNISAGSEGIGFWFTLPRFAIGSSFVPADATPSHPNYKFRNVNPSRTNLRQFDFNSSHSSPIGLNFDRGSDIEQPFSPGDAEPDLKPFYAGDRYLPPDEPQINNFTAYKHNVGVYHRGLEANFHENRFADNSISTFITFTQRITDSLFVGHSRTNANLSRPVTGHSIYDGANTLDGIHFAGYARNNAHTFRVHGSARRHTSHLLSNTSFEDDGSAQHVSIANQGRGANHSRPISSTASALYDVDGTLTGHVGGGPGSTVVANHPFFADGNDFLPEGWNAIITDDIYSTLNFQPVNRDAEFQVTAPDGDTGTRSGSNFATVVKTNDGDYTVDFLDGVDSVAEGFEILHYIRVGPDTGSTVVRFSGAAAVLRPRGVSQSASVDQLRGESETSFTVDGDDLLVKFFSNRSQILFEPRVNDSPIAVDDVATTVEGSTVEIAVTANDNDPDGDSLTVVSAGSTVVASFSTDYRSNTPPTNYQFFFNDGGEFGEPDSYTELEFRNGQYRAPNSSLPSVGNGFAHPGPGTAQGNGIEQHAIVAFTVPADGEYFIADSVVSNGNRFSDGTNVKVHVTGGEVTTLASISSETTGSFDGFLGNLTAGETIYIGLGSGANNGGDGSSPFDFLILRADSPVGETVQIANYQDDFQTGTAPAGYQYLFNQGADFGNPDNYIPLEFRNNRFRAPSSNFPNVGRTSAHPGPGTSQGDGFEQHAIVAFTVPADGEYFITDSIVSNGNRFSDGANVKVHITGGAVTTLATIGSEETGNFDGSLGELTAGQTIYIGLGSGKTNGGDGSFPFDFSIERSVESASDKIEISSDGRSVNYTPDPGFVGTDSFIYIVSDGAGGFDTATVEVNVEAQTPATINGQYVFYNNSGFDGTSDRDAIATNRVALRPGQSASRANYTNFTNGLNGIIIDATNFARAPVASDFSFRVGNSSDISEWSALSESPVIGFDVGAGEDGSDQITLTFPDNLIRNEWLEVTIRANENTNLDSDYVFYFGNQVGDVFGNTPVGSNVIVNALDTSFVRANSSPIPDSVGIDNIYDVNRSGEVNALDTSFVRASAVLFGGLVLIEVPAGAPANSFTLNTVLPSTDSTTTSPAATDRSNEQIDVAGDKAKETGLGAPAVSTKQDQVRETASAKPAEPAAVKEPTTKTDSKAADPEAVVTEAKVTAEIADRLKSSAIETAAVDPPTVGSVEAATATKTETVKVEATVTEAANESRVAETAPVESSTPASLTPERPLVLNDLLFSTVQLRTDGLSIGVERELSPFHQTLLRQLAIGEVATTVASERQADSKRAFDKLEKVLDRVTRQDKNDLDDAPVDLKKVDTVFADFLVDFDNLGRQAQ